MYVAILYGATQRSRSGIKSRIKPIDKLTGIIQKKSIGAIRLWRSSVTTKAATSVKDRPKFEIIFSFSGRSLLEPWPKMKRVVSITRLISSEIIDNSIFM